MEQLEVGALTSSLLGLFPSLHQPLLSLLQKLSRGAPKGVAFIEAYSEHLIEARREEKVSDEGPSDFIAKFLKIQNENPAKITDKDIRVSAVANVGAGSDTTSITLSAILYCLCKNPSTMKKLRQELDDATNSGFISDPITFQQAQSLPYLQAVIKEGLRIHPATGFTMPRIVPKGGKEITGHYFPAGTVVGINSWVAHRNKEVFGSDAYLFRPERWLEKESSKYLDAYFFSFGQGSRTCIRKNISLLEISKAIPQVVRYIDFHLENEAEWHCMNHWFVKPKNFTCCATKRSVK
ncbi:cytochrome p450 pisatin [Phlyctema vagabunda]|uniref:Cytochrome p450 pisatin n=1 Tax=Phlyctema vagabunda TaxID=108571 RepID=A0ABR4PI38_9HELO